MTRTAILHSRLIELLGFDADTGVFRWKVTKSSRAVVGSVAGNCSGGWYVQIEIDGRRYLGHRLAFFYVYERWPIGMIDHVNGIKTDNRICNLRECTHALNAANSKLYNTNTSGFRGVSWSKTEQKWCASIKISGKTKRIGYFPSAHEAGAAYIAAANDAFGNFAAKSRDRT